MLLRPPRSPRSYTLFPYTPLCRSDAYNRRCAVSGEKTLPILDAAHIRSYGDGGEHIAENGLLLRTDIHRLFDLGYATVTDRGTFAVSERLKADFDNGVHYYAMPGTEIAAPRRGFAPPAPEAVRKHAVWGQSGPTRVETG